MTDFAYDPDSALVSTFRQLVAFTRETLRSTPEIDEELEVELSFPDTSAWTKVSPLEHPVVHFELDDHPNTVLGMGVPSTWVEQEDGSAILAEAVLHHLNFDLGIWVSPQAGGTTQRMLIRQALHDIFGTATGKIALTEATDGVKVTSYDGGGDVLDRINDLPVYRTTQITLVVSVFGRIGPQEVQLVGEFEQRQKLTIADEAGNPEHLTTIEGPWT